MNEFVNPDKAGGAAASNGIEVRALLLQEKRTAKYFWAVVVDGGGDDAPEVVGRYANSADAKDAAWLTAQRLGGTMVYPAKVRRR